MHLLTVPGINNSGPEHWQTLWEQIPGRVTRRFAPSSWDEPEAADWVAAVERDLADLGPDTIVVSLQNGMNPPRIAARIGADKVVAAFINFSADWQAPGHIEHGGTGSAASRIFCMPIRCRPRRGSPSWCWPRRCCAYPMPSPPTA